MPGNSHDDGQAVALQVSTGTYEALAEPSPLLRWCTPLSDDSAGCSLQQYCRAMQQQQPAVLLTPEAKHTKMY